MEEIKTPTRAKKAIRTISISAGVDESLSALKERLELRSYSATVQWVVELGLTLAPKGGKDV